MTYNIIVLAKQVPDTHHVGADAMTPEGTINRAALPAVFNPDDLCALEQALQIKDKHPQSTITIITMGLPRATEILREGLYRGADCGILLSDKTLGGADTLATSYALSRAIARTGTFDLILCGQQAIDGDTAQVGPQVAQQLAVPQVTGALQIQSITDKTLRIRRIIDGGEELVEAPLPCLITVSGQAKSCRPRDVRLMMKYKHAALESELAASPYAERLQDRPWLRLTLWNAEDIAADKQCCGMAGSPTKVKCVENICFKAKASQVMDDTDEAIESLVCQLIANHNIG